MIFSTLILSLTLLRGLVTGLSPYVALGNTTAQNLKISERNFELAILFDELARHFTPRCLRVVIGDELAMSSDWKQPLVIIQASGKESQNTASFINKNAEKMTKFSCVTYMISILPSNEVMNQLIDPFDKSISRFCIAKLDSQGEAEKFLLDQRLLNEENVAAVVAEKDFKKRSWRVMRRQLLHPSGFPEVQVVNRWTQAAGFNNRREIFQEQMANFYGKKLQGVTLDFRPFTDYEKIPGSRMVRPKPSLDVYILEVIAGTLNFTYDLAMPIDGLWGYLREDGHWVGVVGDVEFRRANFSLCLSVTAERRRSVDFTRVYYIDPLSFVTAKNRPQPAWLKLITPFREYVWLVTLGSVVFVIVLHHIYFVTEVSLNISKTHPPNAFIDIIGSFLGQPLLRLPWMTAGQILMGFWFLYILLITSYYKTALMATLAVPSLPPTINTLLQLLDSDLQYGMIDAKGSEYQLFSTSNVNLYNKLFSKMTFYSSDESMKRVAEGKYAYIYFKSNLETIVSTEYTNMGGETDLHIASEEFFPGGYGWAFPKGAPYRRAFDHVMLRCMQAGLIGKWVKDLYRIYLSEVQSLKTLEEKKAERLAALAKRDDGAVVLNLNHFQGAFFVMFLGYGIGILALGLEIIIHNFSANQMPSFGLFMK